VIGRGHIGTLAALAAGAALVLAGCGNSDGPKKTAPAAPAPSAAQVERAASATRRAHIDEIVSEYLSELRDSPAAARNPRVQSLTGGQLGGEISGAPTACADTVAGIIRVIARSNLAATSKAKRITTAMDAVHTRC
jgi:hypothetical protein